MANVRQVNQESQLVTDGSAPIGAERESNVIDDVIDYTTASARRRQPVAADDVEHGRDTALPLTSESRRRRVRGDQSAGITIATSAVFDALTPSQARRHNGQLGVNGLPMAHVTSSASRNRKAQDDAKIEYEIGGQIVYADPATSQRREAITPFSSRIDAFPSLHSLKDLIDTGTPTSIAHACNEKFGKETKSRFDRLSPADQKELINYYGSQHRLGFYNILGHNILGYGGEGFYLFWDFSSRVKLVKAFFPALSDELNYAINGLLTIPITIANVTYSPWDLAQSVMKNQLLHPEKSMLKTLLSHPVLTAAFGAFAFGGAWVEVIDVKEFLEEYCGRYGQYVPIAILVYAAVAYYYAYNYEDTLSGFKEYFESKPLLRNALDPRSKLTVGDRAAALFVSAHELATLGHRIVQMGYGGFSAGDQESGELAAWIIGCIVGAGTVPVALATRVMATEKLYYNTKITDDQYAAVKEVYNAHYAKNPVWEETKLFFTATLLALVPIGVYGYETGHALSNDNDLGPVADQAIGVSFGIMFAVMTHIILGLRFAAMRKAITEMAVDALPVDPNAIVPNTLANVIGSVSNFTDQLSRGLNFIIALNKIFPAYFNFDTKHGFDNIITALFESLFISLAAFRYQRRKTIEAIVEMFPGLLGTKPEDQNAIAVAVPDRADYADIDAAPKTAYTCSSLMDCFGIRRRRANSEPIIAFDIPRSDANGGSNYGSNDDADVMVTAAGARPISSTVVDVTTPTSSASRRSA